MYDYSVFVNTLQVFAKTALMLQLAEELFYEFSASVRTPEKTPREQVLSKFI